MCEPSCIKYTGGSSFTCSDKATARAVAKRTYESAVELFAMLCKQYNLNPTADGVIISHREGHSRGIASNHGDPEHLWNGLGMGYTMDGFRKAVKAKMNGSSNTDHSGTSGLQASALKNLSEADVIAKVGPLFTADQKASGILASVSLAQFILESGYGKSELAQNANNCFGMKKSLSGNTWGGSAWDGTSIYTKKTQEYENGAYVTVTADFRKYPSVEKFIADHSDYLLGAKNGSRLRYDGLKGCTDYKKAVQIIKDGGYATSPTYVENLCSIIEKDIADYKSKLKEAQSRPCYNPRHNKPENEPAFFKEMSDECMSRAIAILDTVFKSIESLGGSINSDLSVKIRDDIVRFRMVESQDQVKHEMTKQEAQELVKYNDDIKNHRWASKPQIRKYDKVYNGKLRIEFGERSYIRDNDSEKLEDRLGDILVTLYEKAEENRIVREAREEAERKRVEEARCREENRQRKEQEIRLVKELVNKAEDYRIAKEIREYIQAMIDSGNEDITPEWIEWALKKADWYDPSIETEDEYLGKRQHEKSAEEKEKSLQDSIRKSWYW